MNKRKTITKKEREYLFKNMDGRCGYCGHNLPKRWHVDHIIPIASSKGKHCISNMIAACPQCNNYKNTFSLEEFRNQLSMQVERARDYSVNFRMAEKFGLISVLSEKRIKFYFEKKNEEMIKKVISFCKVAHGNQKYDNKPYFFHLKSVVNIVIQLSNIHYDNSELIIVAYLHDSIEDTFADFDLISREFNIQIAQIVEILSKNNKSKEEYLEGFKECPKAAFVKVCDRIANMEYSIKNPSKAHKYIDEFSLFYKSTIPYLDKKKINYDLTVRRLLSVFYRLKKP